MDRAQQASWAERVLVERLAAGDESALADLYDRYAGFVFALAVRTLVDRQAAQDVLQEVFVALWEHPERIRPERGTLRGYIGTVTHRRAVDVIRREESLARRELRAARLVADEPDVAEAVIRADTAHRVQAALGTLPATQREALELAYFRGHTYRQVAEVLGIPEGTAKSRLRLALARIARSLGPDLDERTEHA